MPLVAQVTGAVALTALIVGPWWASAPDAIPAGTSAAVPAASAPAPAATATPAVPASGAPAPRNPAPVGAAGPAHLNLDVRHSFASVNFSVTVDGKPALQTKIEGGGKRFGVFGKRSERGFTRTLQLAPGVHLVRIRVLSAGDKFDQTRVERFELGSSAVASMRISADKSGLTLVADRPPAPSPAESIAAAPAPAPVPVPVAPPVQAAAITVAAAPQASPAASRQDVNAVADLLQSVRSMLIAIAGFVASAATGFVVQEYLRARRSLIFAAAPAKEAPGVERRRRRRPGKPQARDEKIDEDDDFDEGVESTPDREGTTA